MELRQVDGSCGAVLRCGYTPPDPARRTLMIALPFGVPLSVAEAAFARFGGAFNVVTWESRLVLNLEQSFNGDEPMGPEQHAADMVRILEDLGVERCLLIGYCSGAGISLFAARRYPEVFEELILVNGEYQLFRKPGHTSTDYQRSIDTFLPVVATSRQQAAFIFSKMAEISKVSKQGKETELDRQINLPFSQEETLYRYAANYMAYRDFDALEVAAGLRQATFVLSGGKDAHSSVENSQAVERSIAGARWFVDDQGDHYEFCRPGSVILDEIDRYLAGKASSDAAWESDRNSMSRRFQHE
ncbi:MAG: alpha/beta hydrolase [Acidobacteria bacterium]|nr:alpha/beta hydrolase [Acidobacteriota bacterium]